ACEARAPRVDAEAPDHPKHQRKERSPVEPATGLRLDCLALGETESSSAEEHLDRGYPSPGRVHDRPAVLRLRAEGRLSSTSWNALAMPRKTYPSATPTVASPLDHSLVTFS